LKFCAPLLNKDFILSSIFGAKTAEVIIPEPLKSQIREAGDVELTVNNLDLSVRFSNAEFSAVKDSE
jgi:hypothetical protein